MIETHYNVKPYPDFPHDEYEARYKNLINLMASEELDALLITTEENIRYFTGFKSLLFKTRLRPMMAIFPTDTRHEPVLVVPQVLEGTAVATSWLEDIRTNIEVYGKPQDTIIDIASKTLDELALSRKRIGFEFGTGFRVGMTQQELLSLQNAVPDAQWIDAGDLIWKLRTIKSPREVEFIRVACQISAAGIEAGFKALRPGMTERELHGAIASAYYREGAEDHLVIFHSGAKGNQIRDGYASDYPFAPGNYAKIDGGAMYRGYWCDYCRIVGIGRLLESQRLAIQTSARANSAAIKAMRHGVSVMELAKPVDDIIRSSGFKAYVNTIGHGVGLDIHELPWLDRNSPILIQKGMVLAVEVSVVDENRFDDGSYTFEDNVLVTEKGAEVLTDAIPAELVEI